MISPPLTIFSSFSSSFCCTQVLLYLFGFGIMLCMFETPLKAINQVLAGNCGFMEHASGRFVFLLLVGSLCFAYGVWGIVAGIVCIGASALNLYAGIVYQRCMRVEVEDNLPPGAKYNNAPYHPPESHNPMQQQPVSVRGSLLFFFKSVFFFS
jgi:hypothetical protein